MPKPDREDPIWEAAGAVIRRLTPDEWEAVVKRLFAPDREKLLLDALGSGRRIDAFRAHLELVVRSAHVLLVALDASRGVTLAQIAEALRDVSANAAAAEALLRRVLAAEKTRGSKP